MKEMKELKGREIVIALMIGGIMGILFMAVLGLIPSPEQKHGRPDLATEWIKKRMAYHGTHSCYEKKSGSNEYYFRRNGKEIKL